MSTPTQGVFIFPDHVKGTTLKEQSFTVVVAGLATTLVSASIKFAKDGAVTLTPSVTVTTATAGAWVLKMNTVAASSMGLAVGIHTYDIQTTDSAGTVEKFVRGTINILPSPQ